MAEGVFTSGRICEESELSCDPCHRKNKWNNAVKYCEECQVNICMDCFLNHNSFPSISGHTMTSLSRGFKMCKKHSGKKLDMFCEKHKVDGCNKCMQLQHKDCSKYVHVIRRRSTPEQDDTNEIQKAMTEMDDQRKRLERNKEDLNEGKSECIKKIKQIMDRLHQLEQATNEETEARHNSRIEEINNDIKMLTENIDTLKAIHETLESDLDNTSAHSDIINSSKAILAEVQKLNLKLKQNDSRQLVFIPNQELENLLQGMVLLGTIDTEIVGSEEDEQNTECDIPLPTDVRVCDVRSICVSRNGDIFVADYENKSLITVKNQRNTEPRSIKLNGKPLHVCTVNEEEILVCLEERSMTGSRYKLQFISSQDDLKKPREPVKLDHPCGGIAVTQNRIFISDDQEMVYIYSLNDSLNRSTRKKIFKDREGHVIFKQSRAIVVNEDENKVYVINGKNGLVVLERNGDFVKKLQLCLSQIQGVCMGNGNVVIADNAGINMIKLSPDNTMTSELLIDVCDLTQVQALCYNRRNRMLSIATKGSNMIHQRTVP